MKPCPACGYGNPDTGAKCAVCGGNITEAPVKIERPPGKGPGLLIAAGLLLLCCGAAFFFTPRLTGKVPFPKISETGFSDEAEFNYSGVLGSLAEMEHLRFLPRGAKAGVIPLASSPEDRVGRAAVKLLGKWAREDADPGDRRTLFEALLKSAASGRSAARGQAAFEAGICAAEGFPFKPYLAEIKNISAALVSENDAQLKTSGFFLASMAGLGDFNAEMRRVFALYPSGVPRIYAACALARLGDGEGLKYLLSISSRAIDLSAEADSCLGYAAAAGMPRPLRGPFLFQAAQFGQKKR